MQDLTPAGLTEDGTCLLLVTARGERFLLPIDDQLQRLVGTARASAAPAGPTGTTGAAEAGTDTGTGTEAAPEPRPATPATPTPTPTPTPRRPSQKQEHPMESALRPRDIQARIRSGESAEAVASAAGTSVEAIMPFAAPVLAERAHQAQAALRASLRRGGSGARTLGEAVDQFLADHRLHEDDVAWDSWRRPDGRWALTASVEVDGRTREAEFLHDVAGRYVVTQNDDAAVLTGGGEGAATSPAAEPPRRLSAVGDAPHGDDLGDDAIAMVRDRHEPAVLDAPTRAGAPDPEPEPEPVAQAPIAQAPVARPVAPEHVEQAVGTADTEPVATPDPDAPAAPAAETEAETENEAGAEAGTETDDEQPELDLGQPAQPQRKGRRGRSSVPSWDEIMFGGGTSKD